MMVVRVELGRTGNSGSLVQRIAGTAPEEDGDGSIGGGLPGKLDGFAGLGVQALRRDVERVGAIGVVASLGKDKERGGGDGQKGGRREKHVDRSTLGVRSKEGWKLDDMR